MKRGAPPIRAFLINPDQIEDELNAFGLAEEEVKNCRGRLVTLALRLYRIPVQAKPLLEKAALTHGAEIVFSGSGAALPGLFDVIIIATENQLTAISAQLQLLNKSAAKLGVALAEALERKHKSKPDRLVLGEHSLPLGSRTLIMGILNVTPDSFSDGGRFDHIDAALEQAYRMAEEGADIIDIGGESTRPGHKPVPIEDELQRVIPVIEALKGDRLFKLPLSIDTYKAEVAEQAVDRGAEMINDVWGMKDKSTVGMVAAEKNVPICLMHNRSSTDYDNLIPDILCELLTSVEKARMAGISEEMIIIDPGIGFGKDLQQNLDVMLNLNMFCSLGYPLLLGASRKSMIGKTLNLPVEERMEGTAATTAIGISAGVDIVRVHEVREMRRVAAMTDAMCRRR